MSASRLAIAFGVCACLCACSALVSSKLDEKPPSGTAGDAGTADAGTGDAGAGVDAGSGTCMEDDEECAGSESCNVFCNTETGMCEPGPGTGALCGDTTNERCVGGICRTLPSCNPANFQCPNLCNEICVPISMTAGVCILTSDFDPGLTADGYPCGPASADGTTADFCFMGVCREDVRVCRDDGGCNCRQRCVVFGDSMFGGCINLPGTMARPAGSPCTGLTGPGTCGRANACTAGDT